MSTTYETLRDLIVAQINTVASIGLVYGRERWEATWTDFLALFKDNTTTTIRGWTLALEEQANVDDKYAAMGQHAYMYKFVVRGYLGFEDAANTDDTFSVLVEEVRAALDDQASWSSTPGVVKFGTEVIVQVVDKRMFGSVLCHHAEIHVLIPVVETVAWAA